MINPDDYDRMPPFERQLLRNTQAIALWSLLTFLAVLFLPAALVIFAHLGF